MREASEAAAAAPATPADRATRSSWATAPVNPGTVKSHPAKSRQAAQRLRSPERPPAGFQNRPVEERHLLATTAAAERTVVVFAWAGGGGSGGIVGFRNAGAAHYCQLLDQQCRETLQLIFGRSDGMGGSGDRQCA